MNHMTQKLLLNQIKQRELLNQKENRIFFKCQYKSNQIIHISYNSSDSLELKLKNEKVVSSGKIPLLSTNITRGDYYT